MPANVRPDNLAKKIKEELLGTPCNLRDKEYKRKKRQSKIDQYILQEPRSSAR